MFPFSNIGTHYLICWHTHSLFIALHIVWLYTYITWLSNRFSPLCRQSLTIYPICSPLTAPSLTWSNDIVIFSSRFVVFYFLNPNPDLVFPYHPLAIPDSRFLLWIKDFSIFVVYVFKFSLLFFNISWNSFE